MEQGHNGREYGTLGRHLRKMHDLQILCREKSSEGKYVYWSRNTPEKDTPFDPRDFTKRTIRLPERLTAYHR